MTSLPPAPAFDGRNLIVCCDGTGNVWGNQRDTNVVKLVRRCLKDERQIVYYDPGVGTPSSVPEVGIVEAVKFRLTRLWGLAFGGGIYDDIASAYTFLIRHYRPGDRIYLFGFSRGAFTARAVAGMVNLLGIVRPAGEVMIPTLLRIYFSDAATEAAAAARLALADDIRDNFTDTAGKDARIWFTGVWDTVASVGGLRQVQITSAPSTASKRFDHLRHALSAAEYRAPYQYRPFVDENRDEPAWVLNDHGEREYRPGLKQLWFAGVHSDVGGSYRKAGLADCALDWMLHEAKDKGLRLADDAFASLRPDPLGPAHDEVTKGLLGPLWALGGLRRREPPPLAVQHPSLTQRLQALGSEARPLPPLLRRPAFWCGAAATLLLGLLIGAITAAIDPARGSSALDLAAAQLLAPWRAERLVAVYRGHLAWVLWADVLLIAAYLHLACTLGSHAVRRLRHWRADDVGAHAALQRWAQWPLVVAPLADLAEDLLTPWAAPDGPGAALAWGLAAVSAAKWAALLAVAGLVCFAAAVGRREPATSRTA